MAVHTQQRGTKRTCQNEECGARFYDLMRSPIKCPICQSAFIPPPVREISLESPVKKPRSPFHRPNLQVGGRGRGGRSGGRGRCRRGRYQDRRGRVRFRSRARGRRRRGHCRPVRHRKREGVSPNPGGRSDTAIQLQPLVTEVFHLRSALPLLAFGALGAGISVASLLLSSTDGSPSAFGRLHRRATAQRRLRRGGGLRRGGPGRGRVVARLAAPRAGAVDVIRRQKAA